VNEKKAADIQSILQNLLKNTSKQVKDMRSLWRKLQRGNAKHLEISQEQAIELCRQFWTTHLNLSTWFDELEKHCIDLGFATHNDKGELVFTKEQKHKIVNMDEAKLSLDGSDGGVGKDHHFLYQSRV